MSPWAFLAVNLPPRVPTSTEPVLLSITTFPVPDTATFPTVAVDSALVILILPPLSVASISVAEVATLMSPWALLAVNLPSNVPTRSIEPVFVPMTALPCAPSAVPIFALPTVAFSALILPPLSVASISVAEVATLMSP